MEVPKRLFFTRMRVPAIGAWIVGNILMALLVDGNPFAVYARFFKGLFNLSWPCISGNVLSDFQAQQCGHYWSRLAIDLFWSVFPLLVVAAFLKIGYDLVSDVYRIGKSTPKFLATVTDPAETLNDRYGWFHCMRAIMVEFKDGRQAPVYIPLEAEVPKPGTRVGVIDLGMSWGKRRFLARCV